MEFTSQRKSADLIVVPFWEGKKHAESAAKFSEFETLWNDPIATGDFKGKEGETLLLYIHKPKWEKRLLLLGIGAKEKLSSEVFRRSYAAAVRIALSKKCDSFNLVLPDGKLPVEAILEGILLTNYAFDKRKKEPAKLLTKVGLIGADQKLLTQCKKLSIVSEGINFARDLINDNADEITPLKFAQCAEELAKKFPAVKTTIFDRKEIEKKKMGLLFAVGRGSQNGPYFIIMEYKGNPSSKERTAIIGKGITYDTGGLNLKPTGGIETMRSDMSGAATIMGTMQAVAALKLKTNLIGVIATTENPIGPEAYKPGDVYQSYLGKTVEISNTDAEGRLVLADAIAYTQEHLKPTRIIDFATLTGGMVVALGEEITGFFSNNEKLAKALQEAGEETYERVWRLPLLPEYKEHLKSTVADIKNAGGRKASPCTAAIFLHQFVDEKIPWAHLDIAGTAFNDLKIPYHTTQATGIGIRLMIQFLKNLYILE
jgi:leucyl aminopeptidase